MLTIDVKILILKYLPLKTIVNIYCHTTLCLNDQIWYQLADRFGFNATNSNQFREQYDPIERNKRDKISSNYSTKREQLKMKFEEQKADLEQQFELDNETVDKAENEELSGLYDSDTIHDCEFARGWWSRQVPKRTMLIYIPALKQSDMNGHGINKLVKGTMLKLFGYYPVGKYPLRSDELGIISLHFNNTFNNEDVWLECKDKIKNSTYQYVLGDD